MPIELSSVSVYTEALKQLNIDMQLVLQKGIESKRKRIFDNEIYNVRHVQTSGCEKD